MRLHIARDRGGSLRLFNTKPIDNDGWWEVPKGEIESWMLLPRENYPEITYERSPVCVKFFLLERITETQVNY